MSSNKKPKEAVLFDDGFIIFDKNGNYYAGKTAHNWLNVSKNIVFNYAKKNNIVITDTNDNRIKEIQDKII
jgi:hypothetical protein